MEYITIVIRTNTDLKSFCIENQYMDRLVTNIQLYKKDFKFIDEYIQLYGNVNQSQFLPSNNGIIFIDFINNIILDSQNITGINKITPSEIKRSKNGKIPDETIDNSIFHRFMQLLNAGYLIGFEEWRDNGHHLNTKVLKCGYNELMDQILENCYNYGQFVFSTKPFKIEIFNEQDFIEQTILFNKAKKLDMIPEYLFTKWGSYLEGLKK